MSRKRSLLLIQVLSFLLVTLLGIATGSLTRDNGALPQGLEILQRGSLPLAGGIMVLIIGLMVWQHVTEEQLTLPARPSWDPDRSPFPGLEAFTEQDSAVFFGRDTEITELLNRLHPVVPAQANRLVTVVGPSGAGKSSLVQAGVVPRLRQRRGGWIIVPPVVPGDNPLRSLTRSLAASCPESSPKDALTPRFGDELRTAYGRPSAPVLVIVDQAEELITLSGQGECWTATMTRFEVWHGRRMVCGWPPDRKTEQCGFEMPTPVSRLSSSARTPNRLTAWRGPRTADESPLLRRTTLHGYGTPLSVSSNSSLMLIAASLGR